MFVPVFIIAATSHTEQSIQSPKTTITIPALHDHLVQKHKTSLQMWNLLILNSEVSPNLNEI
ncbi:hypothetical protein [Coxiella burnetii]|uniref:Uncharacterized protein n=2 Tax=Coxiella burnetii TaxID=777 RepID=Q83AV1_COXBU|nr:hypothetical protein [Coxiella burnetii]NP_820757.1 hypothetical protein CBU_1777 [Coxiella burnetii RSA 493]AAO91271.1 hypothetical protein CBU_1777 [Coxiella burnetii RSA 493]ABS76579.1 hypothetical protein CBUD_0230 [Coxiella burnetii Dugway 5J108-111]ABX79125.1 hypothetical protein COXBURSA331_A1973 [Coxiella burnetii RSA 331]AML48327.1 hypothetical protein AUR58_03385 [Coxiella burnetii]AML54338.1 hypothetical protein AYM38_02985 [Coxiella burnetii]